jgi:S-DNA-T family DNA segregation ATPase FtsK/SpoIIIE
MAKKTKKTTKSKENKKSNISSEMIGVLQHRLAEGVFIFVVVLSAYLLLSLFSFQSAGKVAAWQNIAFKPNAGGRVGAITSSAFFFSFGYVAYLFPLLLTYGTLSLLNPQISLTDKAFKSALKILGGGLLFLGLCGLASLLGLHLWQVLPNSSGGWLGLVIARSLFNLFDMAGTTVVLVGLSLIGFTLMTNVSWMKAIERLGEATVQLSTTVLRGFAKVNSMLLSLFKNVSFKRMAIKTGTQDMTNSAPVSRRAKKAKKTKSMAEEPVVQDDGEDFEDFFTQPVAPPAKVKVSERYQKEQQQPLFKPKGNETLPPLTLLTIPEKKQANRVSHADLEAQSRDVEQKLLDFGVEVNVVAVHPGPVITRYELQLAPGLKVSKISALGKDLARSLSVTSVRVVEVIPGKSVVGLELPNTNRDMVCLSEVLATEAYDKASSPLALALGVDIAGSPVIVDLAKMPHLLVAGTTGSGKSVGINAMLLSLLFKSTPDEVRLILVDPKMLELSVYDGIPHLLTPVVTDMKDAASALRWSVMEMERRYRLMAALGVRNISGFNKKVKDAIKNEAPIQDPLWKGLEEENAPHLTTLPSIVVVIDELADMMMVVGKKVEQLIARIAQKARAAGIHLILATQRPSVDVLTGLIKSNIPTRVAFQVSSKIDSRTILDQQGADQLLGHGDMLYLAPGSGAPARVHGAFVDDNEVHRVADAWRQLGEPDYIEEITQVSGEGEDFSLTGLSEEKEDESDPLYDEAVAFVTHTQKASTSSVQRRFKIGYNRAARLIEDMEKAGVVGPLEGSSREVLAPPPPKD